MGSPWKIPLTRFAIQLTFYRIWKIPNEQAFWCATVGVVVRHLSSLWSPICQHVCSSDYSLIIFQLRHLSSLWSPICQHVCSSDYSLIIFRFLSDTFPYSNFFFLSLSLVIGMLWKLIRWFNYFSLLDLWISLDWQLLLGIVVTTRKCPRKEGKVCNNFFSM